jgi:hypothetical protein
MVLCDRFVTAITEACEKSHDCKGTDVCSHCSIGAGLAFTVGLWLLGLLIAGGINLL